MCKYRVDPQRAELTRSNLGLKGVLKNKYLMNKI